jgi:hypothetical protein
MKGKYSLLVIMIVALLATTIVSLSSFTAASTVGPVSSASVSGPYQNSRTFTVYFSASDATSSVTSVQLYYRYGSSGSFAATGSAGSGTSGFISFTAAQDGLVQFYTIATDSAGNVEAAPVSADTSTTVDTVAPSVSVHAPSGLIGTTGPTIQVSASDATSTVSSVTVSVDGGASHAASLNGAYYEYAASGLAQGAHSVTATATDAAGNPATSSPATSFTVDTIASNLLISSPSAGFIHVVAVPVSGTASDSSGILSVQWQVDSTAGSWTAAVGTTSWSFTTGTLSQGAHTIYVKATDGVGNIQTTSVAITVQSTYTITVIQGLHGTITPGTTDVNYDDSQAFTITADPGYKIATVTVDGSIAVVASPYTFTNVQATHTITASFAKTFNPTTLTIAANPLIINKYDAGASARVSGYLTSNGNGASGERITISYNDGGGWNFLGYATTGQYGYYFIDFLVTPSMANGYVAFMAEYPGDNFVYSPSTPAVTGIVNGETGNLHVVPEYLFGGLAALGVCFVGFAIFKKRSSLPIFRRQ